MQTDSAGTPLAAPLIADTNHHAELVISGMTNGTVEPMSASRVRPTHAILVTQKCAARCMSRLPP